MIWREEIPLPQAVLLGLQHVLAMFRLGICLSDVDAAFLSHAHYDHSGGYREFFSENSKAALYLQKGGQRKLLF